MTDRYLRSAVLSLVIFCSSFPLLAQPGIIPTLGKEFWVGFMFNPPNFALQMDIFVSSDVNTTGTVSVPLLGINIPFTVVANVTTTVTLSSNDVMHTTSEVVDNKGVLITTADTVAVFAINFQTYSADAAVIYPFRSLDTEYRVFSHRGLVFGSDNEYASEFLIVSPRDGTEVEITTTCNTQGGHLAGVPWIVQLDSGQTYQVKAANGTLDLTGSTVIGTAASGSCRPFAVFSGTSCARIPEPCTACDHIFAQNLPRTVWGTRYHSVPFATTSSYAYRLMSDVDNTVIEVNGGSPVTLNAGQWANVYDATGPMCFTSGQRFAVAQYMQGVTCANNGDPSMLLLNAQEQRITRVTFATVQSTVITAHYLNLVSSTSDIGSLTIDGVPIPAASFTPYTACPEVSYASLPITAGSHTLVGPGGFSGYVYGMGSAESYAYSVGSFSDVPPLPVDSVLCGLDSLGQVTLQAPSGIFNPYWTLYSNMDDTLQVGAVYTFAPPASDVYAVSGTEFASGCDAEFLFSVEVADPPLLDVTADGSGVVQVCAYEPVQLNVIPTPAGSYVYSWWPSTTLNSANIPNPIATPANTTWYYVSVSTLNGCAVAVDSVLVTVVGGTVLLHEALPAATSLCLGDSVQFDLNIQQVVGEDMLDGALGSLWQSVSGGVLDDVCGTVDGDALYFNGSAPRTATTIGLNVPNGGTVRFALKVANGIAPCDNAEVGDDIVLQYSLTGGAPWVNIATYLEFNYPDFVLIDATIPPGAFSANTSFRWTQVGTYGVGQDNWVLDQVSIAAVSNAGLTFEWSPGGDLESTTIASPWAYPSATGWYGINTTDPVSGCVYTDSVFVNVGDPFSITMTPDTALCDVAGIVLNAVPSSGTGHTWTWTPATFLSAPFVQSPTATPTVTTTYAVAVTNEQGCLALDTVTINVAQLLDLNVTASPTSICAGETVELTAVVGGGGVGITHSWSPAGSVADPTSATTFATPTSSTMFVDVVTDTQTGCMLMDSVMVNVTNLYTAVASNDTLVCTSIGLPLNVVHNVPAPATIVWSPAPLLSNSNTASPTVQFDSTMTYSVVVSDADGCSAFDSVVVVVVFADLDILTDTAFCEGGSVVLDAGFPDATHQWSSGESTQTLLVESSGDYTVTITSPGGCTREHTTTVVVHPLPVFDLGVDPGLCAGESWTLDTGHPLADHQWSTGEATPTISVSADGTYGVTVTDGQGCVYVDSIALVFHPLPVIILSDTTVCISEVITVDAGNAGSTYLWSTGETSRTIDVSTVSATVQVVVTTPENCVDSASVNIAFIPFPVVDLGPDTALCETGSITFSAEGPDLTYLWSTGSSEPNVTFMDDALVWVAVNNGYCTSFDTVNVVFNPLPLPALLPLYETCLDIPPYRFMLDAGNSGCSFLWNTGETEGVIHALYHQVYSVLITTPQNCSIEESTLLVEYCPNALYVPNSFTPNGDGENDVFFPVGNNIATLQLEIFDRWGKMIYSGVDAAASWNGTMGGEPVQDGVYIWKLHCRFYTDSTQRTLTPETVRTGHVTVLR